MTTKKKTYKTSVSMPKSRLEIVKENKLKGFKVGTVKSRKIFWKKFRKIGLILLGVFLIIGVIASIRLYAYLQEIDDNLPDAETVFVERPVASEIYDNSGQISLRRLFNEYNSDPVDISLVPETVKWSFLAAEDSDFYTHQGFDPIGIMRCGLISLRSGAAACGGSTITQQLVKIAAPGIGSSVSLERKIKELLMSIRVEQQYDKDQILEMYLRVAPFGSNIYGMKTAANFYFGKEAKDLSLAEASVLAAIIQDPIDLSPTLGRDKKEYFCRMSDGLVIAEADIIEDSGSYTDKNGNEAIKANLYKCRQLYILGQMSQKKDKINSQIRTNYDDPEKDDVFTEEIIEEARRAPLNFLPPVFSGKAGHFVDYVLDYLTKRNYKNGEEPFTLDELQKGGYTIITSLDYQVQQIAESYVQKAVEDGKYANMNNAAVMTTIPSTGEIIAMAGSKSYLSASEGCDANGSNCKFNGQVNIFRSLQSIGSMAKAQAYYMAYKNGQIFTKSVLPDFPIKLVQANGAVYEPKNWNGGFLGIGTAEDMLRASRNIPALEVIQMVGVDNYVATAKEWGYTTLTGQEGPAVVLGGSDIYGDEHIQAFSVFANNGDLVKLNPIKEIRDKNGNVIYTATPDRKTVADPQGVFLLNQTLKNLEGISWDQRDLAAKTGTSSDSRDAWLITWSPDFVNLAWGGNNNNEPMDQNYGYPPYLITPWVKQYLRDIGNSPKLAAKTPFTRPGFVYEGGGDCDADGNCLGMGRGWLINDRTPARDIKQNTIKICTDQRDRVARPIDIALGKAENATFNYYLAPIPDFQADLDKYLRENANPGDGKFPNGGFTDPCTVDRSGGVVGPFFNIGTADASSASNIRIAGGVYTSSGSITSVQFYLDNQLIPSCTTSSFDNFDITCNISSLNIDSGIYDFRGRATDSNGITNNSANIKVTVGNGVSSNFQFVTMPPASLTYGINIGGVFTQNIEIQYNVVGKTLIAPNLFVIKTVGGNSTTTELGTMTSVPGNKWRYSWGSTVTNEDATYKFFVRSGLNVSTAQLESGQSSAVTVSKNP